jgi:hypothetical protein
MREKAISPNLNPNGQRESGKGYPRRANSRRRTSTAGSPRPRRNHSVWPNCRPASKTNSRLTSTGRAGNTDQPANGQARVESKSSVASIWTFQIAESMGLEGRLSAVGVIAAGWTLINGCLSRSNLRCPADPGARDRVFYGRERFVCEKTRPPFRPLEEKRCFHLRGDVIVSRG